MNFYSMEERRKNMLRIVITRPGPEFSFRTRYPAGRESCRLVPPLIQMFIYSVKVKMFDYDCLWKCCHPIYPRPSTSTL